MTREWASFSQDIVDRDDAHAFRDLDCDERLGRVPAVDVGWSARRERAEGPVANERLRKMPFRFLPFAEDVFLGGGRRPAERAPISNGKDTRGWGKGKRREGKDAE